MIYAYARVSSADQNLNRQIDSFTAYGVVKRNIFTDKKSGKDFERESYQRLLKKLKRGDLLIIKSIDRLGRNYDMIITEWQRITKSIGADILVLDMPLLDTRSQGENLTGKLISDIVLQLLSYVAQKERENIKTRQKEGIAAAKSRGIRFGRPTLPMPPNLKDVVDAYQKKEISLSTALQATGLKQATFYAQMRALMQPLSQPTPSTTSTSSLTVVPTTSSINSSLNSHMSLDTCPTTASHTFTTSDLNFPRHNATNFKTRHHRLDRIFPKCL